MENPSHRTLLNDSPSNGQIWQENRRPDLVTYLENISVTQCISGFAKIWTPTTWEDRSQKPEAGIFTLLF